MPSPRKPTVVIVAGPNGSGKTSFLRCVNAKNRIVGEWINPDEIAQADFGGWNDLNSIIQAANEAERRRESALVERRDFTFETVLSGHDKLDFLERAKQAGYFVRAYFVGTESPEINVARVNRRVQSGGHSVPNDKIVNRYYRSMANLSTLTRISDIAQVFDNSLEDQSNRHMLSFFEQKMHKQRLQDLEMPKWGWNLLNLLQVQYMREKENGVAPVPLDRQIVAALFAAADMRSSLLEQIRVHVEKLETVVQNSVTVLKWDEISRKTQNEHRILQSASVHKEAKDARDILAACNLPLLEKALAATQEELLQQDQRHDNTLPFKASPSQDADDPEFGM